MYLAYLRLNYTFIENETALHLGGYSLNPSTEGTKLMLYKSTKVLAGVCCALLICLFTISNSYGQQNDCIELHTPEGADCSGWTQITKIINRGKLL
jgi:preprotein translocase subunit SecG